MTNNIKDLLAEVSELKEKLQRSQRQVSGLRQKSKYLELQYEDSRSREKNTNDLIMELLERQRELNVMLNRANIMLNRTQETMALTSVEFNEMAKALPEPKKQEWADRVARINELFKKSGVEDAEVVGPQATNPPPLTESLDTNELRQESKQTFHKASVWDSRRQSAPPEVHAEPVEEKPSQPQIRIQEPELTVLDAGDAPDHGSVSDVSDAPVFPPRRKSWWRKAG